MVRSRSQFGRISRRNLLKLGTGGLAALASPWQATAQTFPRIDYSFGSLDPLNGVTYVAVSKGFFKDEGLDANMIYALSGPRNRQMIAAGQVLIGTAGAVDPLAVTVAGKRMVLVFGNDRRIHYGNILVHRDEWQSGKYRKVADLAGTTVAVTQPNSVTWLMGVYAADKAGIKDKVDFRGMGDLQSCAEVEAGRSDHGDHHDARRRRRRGVGRSAVRGDR
jgi:NitT/TauT family transport system substrate-binding protein